MKKKRSVPRDPAHTHPTVRTKGEMRMSVMKKHVFVCTQPKPPGIPNCQGAGGMEIWEELKSEVFRAGKEKDILVSPTGCLGTCGHGPNVVVYPEGTWYTNVKKEEIPRIVEEHLVGGTPLSRENVPSRTLNEEIAQWQGKHKEMMLQAGKL